MLLVRGRYVWTGSELLSEGAVLCSRGKVAEIGSWSRLREEHPQAQVIGGPGAIVLPGLINAHHHGNGITSFARGVHDDNLEPWLAAMGTAPAIDAYADTLLAALDTVAGGYTTMVLFQSTGRPDDALAEARARIDAARDVGLRIAFGLDVNQRNFHVYDDEAGAFSDLPARRAPDAAEYIQLLDELRALYADDDDVAVFAAPSGPEWVTDETWAAVGAWSRKHGVPLHTHALESPLQGEFARRHFEDGLVAHLDRLGALHEQTSLVHGVFLTDAEFELMAARGVSLITNPGSNLRLRCGVSPVLSALRNGVNVALGTDGCSLGDGDDALAEMRLLFYLQREAGIDTDALTWEQTLRTATTAAARVTPWSDEIGTLAVGNAADVSVFDFDGAAGPWVHPGLHPVHVLLHRGTKHHVLATIRGGNVVWSREEGAAQVERARTEAVAALQGRLDAQGAAAKGDGAGAAFVERVRDYYRTW